MHVSYNKLFKLLIDRGMKKQDLQKQAGISSASVSKLAKNECVRMEVLIKVCLCKRQVLFHIFRQIIFQRIRQTEFHTYYMYLQA